MPLKYTQNKKHIYNWRETHKQEWLDYHKITQRKYDNWKRIKKIFMNILLE